jgi:Nif-specific regulatory protein/two-component system response regulator HydG
LLEIAKLLLAEEDPDRTADVLFRRLLAVTEADRGFIVVGKDGAFEHEIAINLEKTDKEHPSRQFSRSLVRRALETQKPIFSKSVLEDKELHRIESIEHAGAHSLLVVPLAAKSDVFGVLYLDTTKPGASLAADAVEFVTDFAEVAALFLKRAVEREALRRRNQGLERDVFAKYEFPGIVGRHPKMVNALELVGQFAAVDATVLVEGETGTGKELVARALHVNSKRRSKPFVVVHCAALPSHLLESELFGHAKGAFTGADRDRTGRIPQAHGGTLFLDEIGEISPDVQAKLLRFLQFGEIQRPGSDRTERVDVRVVAATHRDLKALTEAGRFRQDLYYRIKVLEIPLPSLRERPSDVPLLAEAFLMAQSKPNGMRRVLSPRALEALEAYDFPGNVRELEHVLQRASILARSDVIDVDLLPPEIAKLTKTRDSAPPLSPRSASLAREKRGSDPAPNGEAPDAETSQDSAGNMEPANLERVRNDAVRDAEHTYLSSLLSECGGNISAASRKSGIHRSYLQRLMTKHGLR